MKIKINQIVPDPNQPRKTFDKATINELQSSFGNLGLIQPITVKPTSNGTYMIIVGERRFTAAKQQGKADIECIVREGVDDKTVREMQFAENTQQEGVPPLELGKAFVGHRKKWRMSQEELARIVGISQRTIANYEGLLAAAANVQSYVQTGDLDASTAYEISTIKDEERQVEVAKVVVDKGLTRAIVREMLPIIKAEPNSGVEHIAIQVQYGLGAEKANRRELLKDFRLQQRIIESATKLRERNHNCKILCGDIANWEDQEAFWIEPNSVDSIITDPPYPQEYLPLFNYLASFASHILKPNGSLFVMVGQSYLPDVISMLSKKLTYHWTLAYLLPGGQSPQLWQRKVNSFWKPLLWFTKGLYKGKWLGDVVKSQVNDNDKDFHEWGQSESGMADLIIRTTEIGDLILDPFMGGGTTGKVALELGRGFIGIDKSPKAVETTKLRLGISQ